MMIPKDSSFPTLLDDDDMVANDLGRALRRLSSIKTTFAGSCRFTLSALAEGVRVFYLPVYISSEKNIKPSLALSAAFD